MKPTNEEIAKSETLWGEYIDPDNEGIFDNWSYKQRLEIINNCFPGESKG